MADSHGVSQVRVLSVMGDIESLGRTSVAGKWEETPLLSIIAAKIYEENRQE